MQMTEKELNNFWSKVNKNPNGCWLWTGAIDNKGYGKFGIKGKTYYAHRVSFAIFNGDIPEGLVLDHVYLNKSCVCPLPDHTQPVTTKENNRRARGVSTQLPIKPTKNHKHYSQDRNYFYY